MNVVSVKINFEKRTCKVKGVELTEGDYNSTKMLFEFDKEDGTKIFEMANPSGNLVYLGEIIDNEIILVGKADVTIEHNNKTYIKYVYDNNVYWYDKESEKLYDDNWQELLEFDLSDYTKQTKDASLFTEEGNYIFEVSLYENDSKLTSASGKLKVLPEQINIDGEIVDSYFPVFDELIGDINEAIEKTNNLNIVASKTGTITSISITDKEGLTTTTQVLDGEKGDKGDKGDTGNTGATGNGINSITLNQDYTLTIVCTDGTSYTTDSIRGAKGDTGATGNGIASISKTGTDGLVDTYTVTYTNGSSTTFNITNGKGISSISKTSTSGLIDTYTITYNDSTTSTYDVVNGAKGDKGDTGNTGATGNGISSAVLNQDYTLTLTFTDGTSYTTSSIRGAKGETGDTGSQGAQGYSIGSVTKTSGTGAAGTTDTYTMYLNDTNQTSVGTFNVYNGSNGQGSGDMLKSVYDIDNDGIVDNAEKVNNHTVLTDVPANALFTDTVYDDTEVRGLISAKQDTLVSGTNIKSINNTSLLGSGNIDTEVIQYSTMPTASATNLGQIVQYTGTTTVSSPIYKNGFFYKCVSDEESTPTYIWEEVSFGGSDIHGAEVIGLYTSSNPMSDNTLLSRCQRIVDNIINDVPQIITLSVNGGGSWRGLFVATMPYKSVGNSINIIFNSINEKGNTNLIESMPIDYYKMTISIDTSNNNTITAISGIMSGQRQITQVVTPTGIINVIKNSSYVTNYNSSKKQTFINDNGTIKWLDGTFVTDKLIGSNAPTTATVGYVGQQYTDTTNNNQYVCTVADTVTPNYTWLQINNAGGSCNIMNITSDTISYLQNKYYQTWAGTNKLTPAFIYLEYGDGLYKFDATCSLYNSLNSGSDDVANVGSLLHIMMGGKFSMLYYNQQIRYYKYYTTPLYNTNFDSSTISNSVYYNLLYNANYFITKENTQSYNVTGNYNPAHKKYVDDKIVEERLKSKVLTLLSSSWVQNQTTNYYEYDITDASITADTYVIGNLDIDNQQKFKGNVYIDSYSGGYKIITDELPTENISMTVCFNLTEVQV